MYVLQRVLCYDYCKYQTVIMCKTYKLYTYYSGTYVAIINTLKSIMS